MSGKRLANKGTEIQSQRAYTVGNKQSNRDKSVGQIYQDVEDKLKSAFGKPKRSTEVKKQVNFYDEPGPKKLLQDGLYIIESGKCQILNDEFLQHGSSSNVCELSRNDCFGCS